MALCSYLCFWTAKDAARIEALWLASPLGQRKKTQERKDYRDMTIAQAVENCKKTYKTKAAKVEEASWKKNIVRVRKIENFEKEVSFEEWRGIIKANFPGSSFPC